jgi:uncharacterized membrane protein YuzA (DUF378 family)
MKVLLIVCGCLAALFTLAQFLQLLGVFGVGPSIPGFGFTLLGLAATIACFKKGLNKEKRKRRS